MKLLKIGRDSNCDIVIHSEKVSSLHAEITLMNNGDMLLEDKGSHNGTFVMNNPIRPGVSIKIKRGDAIRFADTELQWSQVPLPEDNSAYKAIFGIGTNFNNSIQLSGSTVSRYHATIKQGRDGKMYLFDHSKNGTTIDGIKIEPDRPYRIKKKSSVVCGGVPVNLSGLPWKKNTWMKFLGAAAGILLLAGIGIGVYKMINIDRPWTQKKINSRFNSTTVLLMGIYHFEVECGDLPLEILNKIGIPTKFYFTDNGLQPYGQSVTLSAVENVQSYEASGFFVSEDGKILTNLHVAKPWLFDGMIEKVESYCRTKLANFAELKTATALQTGQVSGLNGYIPLLKVKGVSDGILLIPQGAYYSRENAIRCHILSAGDDPNVDVALIQSDKQELPNSHCTFVNVKDSLKTDDASWEVGTKIYTIGFPHGTSLQDVNAQQGIQAFCHDGSVSMINSDYNFTINATSYHGASGSPIFDDHGFLIGILNSGVEKEDINKGIKGKYIKELLDSPYKN